MTVNTTSITSGPYTGNGVTTSFPYTFKAFTDANVIVYQTVGTSQSTLTLGTHYSVTGTGIDGGGNVVMVTAPASGDEIYIRSNYSAEQLTDFDSQGGFYPDTHEDAFDKQTMLIQQLEDIQGRGLRLPLGDSNGVMPELTPSPLGLLRWNAAGDAVENAAIETIDPNAFDTSLITQKIDTWADISTVTPTNAGQLFTLAQHTSGGLGGGTLMAFVGSVTDDGGTQKNCLGGFHLTRIQYVNLTPEMFGYSRIVDMPNATLTAYLDAGGNVQDVIGIAPNFIEQILLGQRDVSMLVMGDSTGNETDEWVYVTAQSLAAKFPTHSVIYSLWNSTSYYAPVTVSTGSGSKKIYINNASIPGATAAHFLGDKRPAVYNSMTADLVIFSYGHNMGTAASYDQIFNFHVSAYSEFIADNPTAEVAVTIQNIDTQFPVYSGLQAAANHAIASVLGCTVIDVREIFAEKYVQGGIADWLRPADLIHPNATGERVWSNIVFNALTNTAKKPSVPRNILADSEQNLVYNDMFYLWLWSDSLPSSYTINSYCTASSDTTNYETKGYSLKLTSTGTVGQIGIVSTDFGGTLSKLNKTNGATFSARVKPSTGSGNNCGRVEVDLGGGVVVSSWPRTEPKNGWYWSSVFLTSAQLTAATKCILSVYSGETTDTVSIDRITVNEGNLLKNSKFKPITTVQFYKPSNVYQKTTNDVLVITGNQVQCTNTIDAYPGFKINITDLTIGTSYTATWTSAIVAANSGVFVRSFGGGGSIQATATPLNTNTITWTAIADSASLQVEILAASAGVTTFTVTNLSILKT